MVAFTPVKFWSVVEPETAREPLVMREEVAVRVPAMALPSSVVEARSALEVAVRVPIVAEPPVKSAIVALPMVAKVEVMEEKTPVRMLAKDAKRPEVVEVAATVVEPKVAPLAERLVVLKLVLVAFTPLKFAA